ncbi:MAG TPA: carbohydrate ABC transporter permease [Ruminiclostridium sp.]
MKENSLMKKFLLVYLPVILGALIMFYPLVWMVSSSFKPELMIFKDLGIWPKQFTLDNYIDGWSGAGRISFSTYYLNTFLIVLLVIIGNMITCSMTAYAFARFKFPLKNILFSLMLATMMLPVHAVLIPQYTIFYNLGWTNSYLPLIIPKFFATDAFFIFLIVQFIRGLPSQLDEAATIDGCNKFDIYYKIIIPLCTPALVTTAIFTCIWTYNDFFSQLLYISEPKKYTVSLGLKLFLDSTGQSSFGQLFAMSSLSLLPVTIFFIMFQKLLVEGVATSGIKA